MLAYDDLVKAGICQPVENGICQFSEEIVRPGKPEQARPSDDYLTDEQIWAISSILVPGFGKDRRDLEHRDLMIKIHCMMLERDKD